MKPAHLSALKANAAIMSQSAVLQHLALLRAGDVVRVRTDAQTRWYSLKDQIVAGIIHAMCELCDRISAAQPSGASCLVPTLASNVGA